MEYPETIWQGLVSPGKSVDFDGLGILQIRSAVLKSGSAAELYCVTGDGRERFALAHLSQESPVCKVSLHLEGMPAQLTCSTGEVVAFGTVRKARTGRRKRDSFLAGCSLPAPQAKKPKLEEEIVTVVPASAERFRPASPRQVLDVGKPASPKPALEATPRATKAFGKAMHASTAAADVAVPPAAAEANDKKRKKKNKAVELTKPISRRMLPSGLNFEVLKLGSGSPAPLGRDVTIRFEGRIAGQEECFDFGSATFRLGLGQVIRGWEEGVKGMLPGEKRRLHVPSRLGYGPKGLPPKIPPGTNLVYEVELLKA